MSTPTPSTPSVLRSLTKACLIDLGYELGTSLNASSTKDTLVESLLSNRTLPLTDLVRRLGRDDLRAACRAHGLDHGGRSRAQIAARLLGTSPESLRPPAIVPRVPGAVPSAGDIVQARHRQYLVTQVVPPPAVGQATRVQLVCLDDDAQGRPLELFWELELGARILQPETHGLGEVHQLDPPRSFAAYLHAVKWNAVTATDARLFQAPFRAGIKLMNHQLAPLKRALELPRANLFIADDVGLGKTIEAGLVMQELLLRQQIDWALIVCPASVALQWHDEMQKRFGLHFEIYDRGFVARRRRERGFGVNPWATHTRFIITYHTLRRPEYRDPLLSHLGERVKKSLLILDEAHTAAPASASKYAVDSRVTKVVRDIAPRFENRLFLSATPHNGHSNSFSALLELLDPQRFTRGVPVTPETLQPVMVRRLKADLRALESEQFPDRKVVQIDLEHRNGQWHQHVQCDGQSSETAVVGTGPGVELQLSKMLAEYTALTCPPKGPGRLVFINLQKRLLSSIEAFARTLRLHANAVGRAGGPFDPIEPESDEDDPRGLDDEVMEETAGAVVTSASHHLPNATGRAKELLEAMLSLAEQHRATPDAKVLSLLAWMQKNQCPGLQVGGGRKGNWTGRRVLIFTEYGDSKRYLLQILQAAVGDTDGGRSRIMQFHGGMPDEAREEVQRAFNSQPDAHPVRILIATDAAREGINLQGHCADLFHYDIPWNPARMEQRNGRIDRTLQPSPEVRCHYFVYPQRTEDQVLRTLVRKVDHIQRELGSLGTVVMDHLAEALELGIHADTLGKLERATQLGMFTETVKQELEQSRVQDRLKLEIDQAAKVLNSSREVMDFKPALLRDAINVGCQLAGAKDVTEIPGVPEERGLKLFNLPAMPDSWQGTLDTLRPPQARDEAPWEWRKRPLLPVSFEPPSRINSGIAHLHLSHPFVQRILSRFLAQGYSAHDLARVTVVRNPQDAVVRVIAFGRLSLFGTGATRLHDQLVSVAAPWYESGGANHLKPFSDKADRKALDQLEELLTASPDLSQIAEKLQRRFIKHAPADFGALWPHVVAEADTIEHQARRMLGQRGAQESDALKRILESQRTAIQRELRGREQLAFGFGESEKPQREQYDQDAKHMKARLVNLEKEIETEPTAIPERYRIVLRRIEPIGMVYLWPATR